MSPARRQCAATVAVLTVLVTVAALSGWHGPATSVLGLAVVLAVGLVIIRDSNLRGRSGLRWGLGCLLVAPIGVPLFVFVAIRDRLRGRYGIDAYWQPAGRWCLLGGILLAGVAAVIALSPVGGSSVTLPAAPLDNIPSVSGTVSVDCSTPLGVALGARPSSGVSPADLTKAQAALMSDATLNCTMTAARRMAASELCLLGAFALALIGATVPRHHQSTLPATRKALETV